MGGNTQVKTMNPSSRFSSSVAHSAPFQPRKQTIFDVANVEIPVLTMRVEVCTHMNVAQCTKVAQEVNELN